MIGTLRFVAAAVLAGGALLAGGANAAFAHDHGLGAYGPVYVGYDPGFDPHYNGPIGRIIVTQPVWHDTSHYDYQPARLLRHGNHYHYEPGGYVFHQTGHWDY